MKYTVDLDSPDFDALIGLVDGGITVLMDLHMRQMVAWGRGSQQAILAGRSVQAAQRSLTALKMAKSHAEPDRSNGTYTGSPSLQTGDDMKLVYGRPRNDPRDAAKRRKTSS